MISVVLIFVAVTLPPAAAARVLHGAMHQLPLHHARTPSPALVAVEDAKASLLKKIAYHKPLGEDGEALIDSIIAEGSVAEATSPPDWWRGCFLLQTCNSLTKKLRGITGPLLDGAPVTVTVGAEDGAVHIETDMLVVGCATGWRVFGTASAGGDGATCEMTLDTAEFFEPSEEFGISKALDKCEAKLRPEMPSAEEPMAATLALRYADDDLLVVRLTTGGRPQTSSREGGTPPEHKMHSNLSRAFTRAGLPEGSAAT